MTAMPTLNPLSFDDLSLEELLHAMEEGSGEDLSFSLLFDEIKEARRADAAYLPQGDWQKELKQSDWAEVIKLSAQALREQSKDLQLSGWLTEGLAHRNGFEGIHFGMNLTQELLNRFWETLHPQLDPDPDERIARLNWLISTLTEVVYTLPLIEGERYALADYEESRQVENQARHDPDAMGQALDEGKINAEIFQRSVVLTETDFLRHQRDRVSACIGAVNALETTSDAHFGVEGPSFRPLLNRLSEVHELLVRLLSERGVTDEAPAADTADTAMMSSSEAQPDDSETPVERSATAAKSQPTGVLRTRPESRDEAFEMLAGVAAFFKQTEPHSPVPYLVERAIKWGRMPLEDWLCDVIKDDGIIEGIRDTLGTVRHED
ncbi:type VI secretion system protein TssA [Terasakiispira papahanaumokuakeensis]|nr:type VI secretion system protein TssA [Terasakiispira papahanaumokuakeensis]